MLEGMIITVMSICLMLSVHYSRGEKVPFQQQCSLKTKWGLEIEYLAAFPVPHAAPGPVAAGHQPAAQVEGLKMR